MNFLLFSFMLGVAPPENSLVPPVPADYVLWRLDQDKSTSDADARQNWVLSRFDLANPTKPELIPVNPRSSVSLLGAARWGALTALPGDGHSSLKDYLPAKPGSAKDYARGAIGLSPDESLVMTFCAENAPIPMYVDYLITEVKSRKRIYRGRFHGAALQRDGAAFVNAPDTIAYLVRKSILPMTTSHGYLVAISKEGRESRVPGIVAWQSFASPDGNSILVADFGFDDEGKKCDSFLSLYSSDCRQLRWTRTVSHTGWSADSVVLGLGCYWSTDTRMIMVTALRKNEMKLLFLDGLTGKDCGEIPMPFNWILPHGVMLCPKSDKRDAESHFELQRRNAKKVDPGYGLAATTMPADKAANSQEVGKRIER